VRNTEEKKKQEQTGLHIPSELAEFIQKYIGDDYITPRGKKVLSKSLEDRRQSITDRLNELTADYIGAGQVTPKGKKALRNKFVHGGSYRDDSYTEKDLVKMSAIIKLHAMLEQLKFSISKNAGVSCGKEDLSNQLSEIKLDRQQSKFKKELGDSTKKDLEKELRELKKELEQNKDYRGYQECIQLLKRCAPGVFEEKGLKNNKNKLLNPKKYVKLKFMNYVMPQALLEDKLIQLNKLLQENVSQQSQVFKVNDYNAFIDLLNQVYPNGTDQYKGKYGKILQEHSLLEKNSKLPTYIVAIILSKYALDKYGRILKRNPIKSEYIIKNNKAIYK